MSTTLALLGIVASFFLAKYRQRVGDMLGEADWMRPIGGVYLVMVYLAILIFFWSIAELTGTNEILFGFIKRVIPGFDPLPPQ